MEKFLLVDGNSLLHRAYHGYPQLTTSKGELVGAVYGVTSMLFTAMERLLPRYLAVTWDVGKVTFRHDQFAEYKAGRAQTEQGLIDQIERTKEVISALNYPQFGLERYEADDLIGTLSRQSIEDNSEIQVVIMTGDRDSLQLVKEEKVVVYMPAGGSSKFSKDRGVSIFDEQAVKIKYGLWPKQIVDLKALMGDASDNIPGVKGVGQVTAVKLLTQFETLEEVYDNIDKLDMTERIKNLLREGKEDAFLSKKLATIDVNVPIKLDRKACEIADYDKEKVISLFGELEFKSLVNRLPKDEWENQVEDIFK